MKNIELFNLRRYGIRFSFVKYRSGQSGKNEVQVRARRGFKVPVVIKGLSVDKVGIGALT